MERNLIGVVKKSGKKGAFGLVCTNEKTKTLVEILPEKLLKGICKSAWKELKAEFGFTHEDAPELEGWYEFVRLQ